ncbi:MAG: hypothetical protein LUQ31_08355 [Methanoregula sp.]|nr:hypothetical protein [Methanoregula sp.]
MSEWDIPSVALILIGCSIIAVAIIIAARLLGFLGTLTPFLLLTAIILVVLCAAAILFFTREKTQKT